MLRFPRVLAAALFFGFFLQAPFGLGREIFVPDDYPAIQAAIRAADEGDVITVRAGIYVETVDFFGKGVTLRSESGPAVTIIDGNQKKSAVSFLRGESEAAVIEGFTITNGSGTRILGDLCGGGILCANSSSPVLRGNIISGNSARYGGGIDCRGSSPRIEGNTIRENFAEGGGGIDCDLQSFLLITGNSIEENEVIVHGGGIRCCSGSHVTIEGNGIIANFSTGDRGGGIYCDGASLVLTGNVIEDNRSYVCGGALYGRECTAVVEGNRARGNTSETGYGGAFNFSSNCIVKVAGNVISDNSAFGCGGGINCCYDSEGMIANNIISNNRTSFSGGGISCFSDTDLTVLNNTITGNSALVAGGGIACTISSTATVTNSVFWDDEAPLGKEGYVGDSFNSSVMEIDYSDAEGGEASFVAAPGSTLTFGEAMIDGDPLFVDPGGEDRHLTFYSPCRNSGDGGVPGLPDFDFEGDPRVIQEEVDMGADEFYYHLYVTGKAVPGGEVTISVTGRPDRIVTLGLGSGIQDPPEPTPSGNLYLLLPLINSWNLGFIPKEGVLLRRRRVPLSWNSGERYPYQALVGSWGGQSSFLTNLLVVTVE